jgi:hypothetical protein
MHLIWDLGSMSITLCYSSVQMLQTIKNEIILEHPSEYS